MLYALDRLRSSPRSAMCRFVVYLGPPITLDALIVQPEHSIIHQSFRSRFRKEPLDRNLICGVQNHRV